MRGNRCLGQSAQRLKGIGWSVFALETNRIDATLIVLYADRMKSAAFNNLIASALSTPEKTVIVYARFLREAGMLTTGARGRNAPEMTPLDAARLTLAILTTDSPTQCVERVKRFGQIKYSPDFKKIFRGYETIQPDQFTTMFEGETLEDVLAYMFGLPAKIGIEASFTWFDENPFHLRVFDFEVLAELFRWKWEGKEVIGERVVPFKGKVWERTDDGSRPVEGFTPIPGSVRTERSISCSTFPIIGVGLMSDQGAAA